MNILLFWITLFLISLLTLEMSFYALEAIRNPDRKHIRKRLGPGPGAAAAPPSLLKKQVLSDIPIFNRLLFKIPVTRRLSRLLTSANAPYSIGFYVLLSLVLGLACYLLLSLFVRNWIVAAGAGCLALSLPFFYLKMKKNKRIKRFQKQLPESLDLLVRSLRAGHAFPTGVQLVAEQFDEPLGPEFRATLDEINFGVSVSDALKNLSQRVDFPDLRYFVVSVILQRETGGNLAEIMESIAYIIRERFKLQRKVDVLSTEGRMSAMVLTALPFIVLVALHFINPEHTGPLWGEPLGKVLIGITVVMMLVGFAWIKRIITIRV